MTGTTLFNRLSKKDRARFEKNLEKQGMDKVDYLKDSHESMFDFIACAFRWDETEEGHGYWENIANVGR